MNEMTMQKATEMGSKMLKLLQRQRLYFKDLQMLSESQRTLIANQQSEELLSVLGKRQKLVQAIGEIHQESTIYREEWPNFKELLPNELRAPISVLLDELQTLLNKIIEQDQEDCQNLSASKTQTGEHLKKISNTRKARSVYNSPAQGYGQRTGGNIQFTG